MYRFILYFILFVGIACSTGTSSKDHVNIDSKEVQFSIDLDTLMSGHTDTTTWFYPSMGVLVDTPQSLVMTIQEWIKGKIDVFGPVLSRFSLDNGNTWSELKDEEDAFTYRKEEGGDLLGVANFTPKRHIKSNTLLGTGHTVRYREMDLIIGQRSTIWATYDSEVHAWNPWEALKMPNDSIYYEAGACADQRVDLPNGDILLPIYYRAKGITPFTSSVVRCSFDGKEMKFLEKGAEMTIDVERGLFEPSLAFFQDEFFLTMRNDRNGYWAKSMDGLTFSDPEVWCFDDDNEVGTYNTMQHWVIHSGALYLVYTRKGANNDNVIRHRAPLFICQVDPESMQLIRSTEKILVPNRGVRVGNFSVTNIDKNQTWITVAEVMMGRGEEKYGANGNVYAAKITWNQPNLIWDR